MRIIDITGPIFEGMWTYGPPYPDVIVEEIPAPDFIEYPTYSWRFELGAQTGTYLETSLHVDRSGPPLVDIPVEKLWMLPTAVIKVEVEPLAPISVAMLEAAAPEINEGDVIMVASGWGRNWHNADFVASCPYFEGPAMHWILDHKPYMMCGDMPRFDSWDNPQHFFIERYFKMGTLLLAPLYNLEAISASRGKLVVMPLKIEETCAAPARVLFIEE